MSPFENARMIEPRNDFAPFIAAGVAASAVLSGQWVWNKLPDSGKFLRLAATVASIVSIAAAALGVHELFTAATVATVTVLPAPGPHRAASP
jgi:hypothetical protein